MKVQEIRGFEAVTRIANAPKHVLGVINLRGDIVPIVDLRIKLQQVQVEYGAATVVIIVELENAKTGMVVDSVSDVLALSAANIRPAPALSGSDDSGFIRGLGMFEERVLILVDIAKLLSAEVTNLLGARQALKDPGALVEPEAWPALALAR